MLASERADIKLGMTLYHCPADHKGICVIDDFEGIVKRDPKKVTSEITMAVHATNPAKY